MTNDTAEITTTVVPEHRRLKFLPEHFGRQMLRVEMRVFAYAGHAIPGYRGGFWEFIECSNGAGYLRLQQDGQQPTEWRGLPDGIADPAERVSLTPDAAGLALTVLAVNHSLTEDTPSLCEEWERLMEVVYQHPEHPALLSILD